MTITALPEDTIRLLGSHTVITTPVDLVKELLDNAIDANATSVEILVSPNIVDKIEVRDNGHGIHPDDYDSLGRAGHTSKIKAFDDLRTLGGTTLGFRGQALASANNLGTVTVTTRTAEDPTAVVLKLTPGVGGVESQQRSSAPVGTAVTVAGLYSRLPVRAQVAVKDAPKNLTKIKHLLHVYALARPRIRLSFRVLGGSNKLGFSYSPRPEAGVKEAVVQVFGTELASQCSIETICSTPDDQSTDGTEDGEKFCIQAVLPRPDADQACISKGAFFSVDSRPVSAQRETMKKLLTTFRTHFSTIVEAIYGEKSFRDPFISVNIKCSPGSYDPNIEPSKDVVLFANESQLTNLFERLCSGVYKRQETLEPLVTFGKRQLPQSSQVQTPPISSDGPGDEQVVPELRSNFTPINMLPSETHQVDLSHQESRELQHTPVPSSSPVHERRTRNIPRRRPVPATRSGFDMSADPDISSDDGGISQEETASQLEEAQEEESSRDALNPWVIAKMNAPIRQNQISQTHDQQSSMPDEIFENLPVLRPFGDAPGDLDDFRERRLDITRMDRHTQHTAGFHHALDHAAVGGINGDYLLGPDTSLVAGDEWQNLPQMNRATGRRALPNLRAQHNERPEEFEIDGLAQARVEFGGQPRRSQPRRDGDKWRHVDEIPSRNNPPFRKPKRVNARKSQLSSSGRGDASGLISDWVDNNRLADYDMKERPNTQSLSLSPRPSTRMSAADSFGRQRTPTMPPSSGTRDQEVWVDGDSRKFLMKRQRSEAEHRRRGRPALKRTKTERLPLETIPESQGLHGLVLTVASDTEKLAENLDDTPGDDPFYDDFRSGITLSEEMGLDDAVEVEGRLKDLLSVWTEKFMGQRTEVDVDLRTQIKGKGLAV